MNITKILAAAGDAPGRTVFGYPPFQIGAIAMSVFFLFAVIELIRRNRLKEKYAILWIFSAIILIIFSLSDKLLDKTAQILGVAYGPSLIFLFAFIFLLFIVFHFSTVLSKESDRSKTLAQKIGILDNKIKELEKQLEEKKKS
jgi:hypothetical protein